MRRFRQLALVNSPQHHRCSGARESGCLHCPAIQCLFGEPGKRNRFHPIGVYPEHFGSAHCPGGEGVCETLHQRPVVCASTANINLFRVAVLMKCVDQGLDRQLSQRGLHIMRKAEQKALDGSLCLNGALLSLRLAIGQNYDMNVHKKQKTTDTCLFVLSADGKALF